MLAARCAAPRSRTRTVAPSSCEPSLAKPRCRARGGWNADVPACRPVCAVLQARFARRCLVESRPSWSTCRRSGLPICRTGKRRLSFDRFCHSIKAYRRAVPAAESSRRGKPSTPRSSTVSRMRQSTRQPLRRANPPAWAASALIRPGCVLAALPRLAERPAREQSSFLRAA